MTRKRRRFAADFKKRVALEHDATIRDLHAKIGELTVEAHA